MNSEEDDHLKNGLTEEQQHYLEIWKTFVLLFFFLHFVYITFQRADRIETEISIKGLYRLEIK